MTATVKDLLDKVLRLKAEEQLDFLDALNLHVAALHLDKDFPIPKWHEDVIQGRLANLERNPDNGTPAEDVYAELLARLQPIRP
jgi:hypothetical protein